MVNGCIFDPVRCHKGSGEDLDTLCGKQPCIIRACLHATSRCASSSNAITLASNYYFALDKEGGDSYGCVVLGFASSYYQSRMLQEIYWMIKDIQHFVVVLGVNKCISFVGIRIEVQF